MSIKRQQKTRKKQRKNCDATEGVCTGLEFVERIKTEKK